LEKKTLFSVRLGKQFQELMLVHNTLNMILTIRCWSCSVYLYWSFVAWAAKSTSRI